jgi:DNA (cytosine-5)-methyltransferase 1
MLYFSPFDGIGAIHVAAQRHGWRCVGVSEIAAFPSAVVNHHWGFRNFGDITNFRSWPEKVLRDIQVVVGGSPCPSFSQAGRRRSLDDERGKLLLEFADLFCHINLVRRKHGRPPAIAIFENVPGILTPRDNPFGHFVGRLLGCDEAPQTESGVWGKAGFLSSETVRVAWRVLNSEFFAVAQRRRRVFLVAVPCELVECFGDRACPSGILSLGESIVGALPPRRKGQKGNASARRDPEGSAQCVGIGESERQVIEVSTCVAFHSNARGSQLPSRTRDTSIADSLTTSQRAAVVVGTSEVAGTLTTSCGSGFRGNGTGVSTMAIHDGRARRLTPRECERLMGFPEDYTLIPYGNKPASKSDRYRALGNSIVVPVLDVLVRRITAAFTPNDTPSGSISTSPGTSPEPKLGLSQSSDVAPVAPAGKATPCRDGLPWPVGTDPAEGEGPPATP